MIWPSCWRRKNRTIREPKWPSRFSAIAFASTSAPMWLPWEERTRSSLVAGEWRRPVVSGALSVLRWGGAEGSRDPHLSLGQVGVWVDADCEASSFTLG